APVRPMASASAASFGFNLKIMMAVLFNLGAPKAKTVCYPVPHKARLKTRKTKPNKDLGPKINACPEHVSRVRMPLTFNH
ncbi:MAG: hypothetical protein QNJ09_01915, partial [Paracoccaceae bacterium]|nr:hypothetical protein [Paracoccaceae bacterium]